LLRRIRDADAVLRIAPGLRRGIRRDVALRTRHLPLPETHRTRSTDGSRRPASDGGLACSAGRTVPWTSRQDVLTPHVLLRSDFFRRCWPRHLQREAARATTLLTFPPRQNIGDDGAGRS